MIQMVSFESQAPGVDAMITNFRDFCLFSAKKWRFSKKKQYYVHIFAKSICSLRKKTPIFSRNFSAKIFLKS
jgi:hypothetical protein